METHHHPGYMKPTQIYASFYTDNHILQTDEEAVWLQHLAFRQIKAEDFKSHQLSASGNSQFWENLFSFVCVQCSDLFS